MAIWRYGDMAIWRYGDMAISRDIVIKAHKDIIREKMPGHVAVHAHILFSGEIKMIRRRNVRRLRPTRECPQSRVTLVGPHVSAPPRSSLIKRYN
jgi:hypothetical protein